MKVILLEGIRTLGQLGEVVEVRPGYARNYLIPQGKAQRANKDTMLAFEEKRRELEKVEQERVSALEKAASLLQDYVLSVVARASLDGSLYGSVTAKTIAAEINKQEVIAGMPITRAQVFLPNGSLKSVGKHPVSIRLSSEREAQITVCVVSDVGRDEETLSDKRKADQ